MQARQIVAAILFASESILTWMKADIGKLGLLIANIILRVCLPINSKIYLLGQKQKGPIPHCS